MEVLLLARGRWPSGAAQVSGTIGTPASNVQQIGRSVFTTYLLAFEVTSALLVVAVVGAVVLVRRPRRAPGDEKAALEADPSGPDELGAYQGATKDEPGDVTVDEPEPETETELDESEIAP